jgi:hypothetical protein
MQELLQHSSLRSTIDIYTQAVTPAKHAAQAAVLSLVFPPNRPARFSPRSANSPNLRNVAKILQGRAFEGAKRALSRVHFAPTNARGRRASC